MFVDECNIEVIAGRGGDGCVSFRREKFVPRGGPDGGDGGAGGNVWLRVTPHRRTLSHLRHTPVFRGAPGRGGMGKRMTGARGADAVVEVPPGTIINDAQTGSWVAEALERGAEIILARGGRGGRGNVHFKRAARRAPRYAEKGAAGETRRLRLTLKLLADVGLVGLPNAGKSTLLSRVSNARPRIADYPFTTLEPILGIVPVGQATTLVFADLPGLIEGAHEGKGLGQRFLRHIERTRLLLVLIEATDQDPARTLAVLRHELERWSAPLGSREFLVCYTKADLLAPEDRARLPRVGEALPLLISAQTGEGLPHLLHALQEKVLAIPKDFDESAECVSQRGAGAAPPPEGASPPEAAPASAGVRGEDRSAERPWPTRWVIPQRPGARIPQQVGEGEDHGERQDG